MNELERHTLLLVGEDPDSPDVFTDDNIGLEQIRDSLSDAIQEIVMLTGGYEEEFHIPLVQDQAFYRLTFNDSYFGWVVDAWLSTEGRRLMQTSLTGLSHRDPRWMVFRGTTLSYMQIGHDVIGVYPAPGSSADVLRFNAVMVPKRYEYADQRMKVRKLFRDAAVNYAVAEYYASRGDAAEAATHFQHYAETIGAKHVYSQSRQARQMRTQDNVGERTQNNS